MQANDIKNLQTALMVIKATRSLELLDAAESFWSSLSFAPTTVHLIPEFDRQVYEIHLMKARTHFLVTLIGKWTIQHLNPKLMKPPF